MINKRLAKCIHLHILINNRIQGILIKTICFISDNCDTPEPPGKVIRLKVTETSYTNMVLTWIKPEEKPDVQDEDKGYFVEIRQADCIGWSRCNSTPIAMTTFNVKGLKSMDMYWVRVIATNDGGESAPEELPSYVLAMPLPGMSTTRRA